MTVYSIDKILSLIPDRSPKLKILLDGDHIVINSLRLRNFKVNGTKCFHCGIEGNHFRKDADNNSIHLGLYAEKEGREILMVKEIIVLKRDGGIDSVSNMRTSCVDCNEVRDFDV